MKTGQTCASPRLKLYVLAAFLRSYLDAQKCTAPLIFLRHFYLFMVVVAIFSTETGFFSRHLTKAKYLGEISYSIYLNQITVLIVTDYLLMELRLPVFLHLAIYLLTLIIYSHFTYQYIEKPFRKKGRNFLCALPKNRFRQNKPSRKIYLRP